MSDFRSDTRQHETRKRNLVTLEIFLKCTVRELDQFHFQLNLVNFGNEVRNNSGSLCLVPG